MKQLATHNRPDMDALISTWMIKRFLFPGEQVELVFVPRSFDLDQRTDLDCVIDVGNTYDPDRLLFDPQQPATTDASTSCTAKLVFRFLLKHAKPVAHLVDFIESVQNSVPPKDRGTVLLDRWSSGNDPHAFFARAKAEAPDVLVLHKMMDAYFDRMERELRNSLAVRLDWQHGIGQLPRARGTYALILESPASGAIAIGRTAWLGRMVVRPGYYVYIGSAFGAGGVRGRVAHHLTPADQIPMKWQVDFLRLLAPVKEVWYTTDTIKRECAWAECVKRMPGSQKAHRKYGASDCRCEAHLYYFEVLPSLRSFRARVSRLTPTGCKVQRLALDAFDAKYRRRSPSAQVASR